MKYIFRKQIRAAILFSISIFLTAGLNAQIERSIPHLGKKGNSWQLFVDGKPFFILGGEVGNSSFTRLEYMAPIWPKLKAMNLNTLLVPVYWELIEPSEFQFNFQLFRCIA